jgi:hypothetical protein
MLKTKPDRTEHRGGTTEPGLEAPVVAPSPRRSGVPLEVVGALIVSLLVTAAVVFVLFSGGDDGPAAGDPATGRAPVEDPATSTGDWKDSLTAEASSPAEDPAISTGDWKDSLTAEGSAPAEDPAISTGDWKDTLTAEGSAPAAGSTISTGDWKDTLIVEADGTPGRDASSTAEGGVGSFIPQ